MGQTFNNALGAGLALWGAYDGYKQGKQQQQAQTIGTRSQEPRLGQYLFGSGLATKTATMTPDQMVAPINADQNKAFDLVRGNVGMGDADYAGAMDTARGAGISDADIQRFMNPYMDDVVNTSLADIERMRKLRMTGIDADAEAAHAFGGDRAEVARALASEDFDRTAATTSANLRAQGFNTALGAATNNAGLKLTGNAQLQQLIDQRRTAATQDANNVLQIGNIQQQNEQAKRDWLKDRVGVALDPVRAYGGTNPYTGAVTSPTANGVAGLVGGAEMAGGIADLVGKLFGNKDTTGNGVMKDLFGDDYDFLGGPATISNGLQAGTPGMPDIENMSDADLARWLGVSDPVLGGFNSAGGEAASDVLDFIKPSVSHIPTMDDLDYITPSVKKIPEQGSGFNLGTVGKVASGAMDAANVYSGIKQGGTKGYGSAVAAGSNLAELAGFGGTGTNIAGAAGNIASGNYVGAAKDLMGLVSGASGAGFSAAGSGAMANAALADAGFGAGSGAGAAAGGAGAAGGFSGALGAGLTTVAWAAPAALLAEGLLSDGSAFEMPSSEVRVTNLQNLGEHLGGTLGYAGKDAQGNDLHSLPDGTLVTRDEALGLASLLPGASLGITGKNRRGTLDEFNTAISQLMRTNRPTVARNEAGLAAQKALVDKYGPDMVALMIKAQTDYRSLTPAELQQLQQLNTPRAVKG